MNPILRNILAVIAGFVIGSIVNMGLIKLGSQFILPPPGVDPMDPESLKAGLHLFEPKHFISPFLGHALGTFAAALTVAKLAVSNQMKFALGFGVFFMIGGIIMVRMINGPMWFNILDLVVAYLPMAWLGGKLGKA